jgi:carbonic anhydrase
MQNNDGSSLNRMLQGIKSFQHRFYQQDPQTMMDLVERGQRPKILVIACSDSRVDPALLAGAQPGDLFVIRNVANLVPPYYHSGASDGTRAAIEYAIRDLKVEHVVVLGHAYCGGIQALLNTLVGQKPPREFLGEWVSIATEACCRYVLDRLPSSEDESDQMLKEIDISQLCEHQHLVERASIQGSIDNLLSYPWLKERVVVGDLSVHGWWFDLESGDLWVTDSENKSFLPILD